jgi:hypothetical protein
METAQKTGKNTFNKNEYMRNYMKQYRIKNKSKQNKYEYILEIPQFNILLKYDKKQDIIKLIKKQIVKSS